MIFNIRLNEIKHLNNNFESIYNKKFSDSGAHNRPNISVNNNKNLNAVANEISNYNTGKDSLFGAKQTKNTKNNINNSINKNSTIRTNAANNNKGTNGRSNSSENNSNII